MGKSKTKQKAKTKVRTTVNDIRTYAGTLGLEVGEIIGGATSSVYFNIRNRAEYLKVRVSNHGRLLTSPTVDISIWVDDPESITQAKEEIKRLLCR